MHGSLGRLWMLLDAALGLLWVFLDAPKGRLKFDRPKEGFLSFDLQLTLTVTPYELSPQSAKCQLS